MGYFRNLQKDLSSLTNRLFSFLVECIQVRRLQVTCLTAYGTFWWRILSRVDSSETDLCSRSCPCSILMEFTGDISGLIRWDRTLTDTILTLIERNSRLFGLLKKLFFSNTSSKDYKFTLTFTLMAPNAAASCLEIV